MADSSPEPTPADSEQFVDPLELLRGFRRQAGESKNIHAESAIRRNALSQQLEASLQQLVAFAGELMSPAQYPRRENFFTELARATLGMSDVVHQANQEYARLQILKRLTRAARSGVPGLETAAALLLLDQTTAAEDLASELQGLDADSARNEWLRWVTYVLDQLLNSNNPPPPIDNVPATTTHAQWRSAELAFGCVLFTDEVFRVLQDSIEQAGSMVATALEGGGYPALHRPAARVRDLLRYFDPRALQWFGSDRPEHRLLQPPPLIDAIREPLELRRQLDEVWTAANYLQIALAKWEEWFRELKENHDAHPAIALNCAEIAGNAISVLCIHRPNVPPFDHEDESTLLAMLPPTPSWWMAPAAAGGVSGEPPERMAERPRWQEDSAFLNSYYFPPDDRLRKATELRSAASQLIAMLRNYPLTAVSQPRPPACFGVPKSQEFSPEEIIRSYVRQAREEQDRDAAWRADREQALRPYRELRPRWDRAWTAFWDWPEAQNRRGIKPSLEGFREWAGVAVELGAVLSAFDALVHGGAVARLRNATGSGVAELDCAAAFLLLSIEGDLQSIADQLATLHQCRELRRSLLWLPYIRDNIWHPDAAANGLVHVAEPPDGVSFDDFQRAQAAFGWNAQPRDATPGLLGEAPAPDSIPAQTSAPRSDPSLQGVSFGILTALPMEYASVKALLPNGDAYRAPGRGGAREYWIANMPARGSGVHRVALCLLLDMGNNSAAIFATHLLEHFQGVRHVVMVGIAGGAPHPEKANEHVRLGDIVVSDRKGVVQYDFDKETGAATEIRCAPRPPNHDLNRS